MSEAAERFFEKAKRWHDEFLALREIVCENDALTEDFKWKHPCYTFAGKNVVLIHGFKEYCALLFHKGVLLDDPTGMLIQQTENVQAARQLRFTSEAEIIAQREAILGFVQAAIELEKAGAKVEMKPASAYPVPEEFQRALSENEALNKAFYSLTPGRQKAYLYYFNQAKQAKTRESRIEKYYQQILDGKGMED